MIDSCRSARMNLTWFLLALCGTACHDPANESPSAAGTDEPLEVATPLGATLVLLPGGTFTMGSEGGPPDEAPPHPVTVRSFAIDKHEVTQALYAALEIPDPSHFKDAQRPVEQVRWSDAAQFCNRRSLEEGLEPCYDEVTFACNFEASGYRLPTEAEWEYAARAGADGHYGFGNQTGQLRNFACYAGNSQKRTDLVGQKRPNAWGLHDMHGNVLEWCHDIYDPAYYQHSPQQDPRGPTEGKQRVLRGGSWSSPEDSCRSSTRFADVPGITDACFARDTYGFRCVRRLTASETERLEEALGAPVLAAHP